MKRVFCVILCLCLLLSAFPFTSTVFAEDETAEGVEEVFGDTEEPKNEEPEIEEVLSETIVDETAAVDIPEETDNFVPEELGPSDPDSEIFTNFSFDEENRSQLQYDYVLDEIIIKFKDPSQVPGKEKQLQHEIEKVEKVGFVEQLGAYVVRVADLGKNPNAVLNQYKNNKYIEYVEPNYIAKSFAMPDDPELKPMATVLSKLGFQDGWSMVNSNPGVIIAIVDTGVASHPDLPKLLEGYSAAAGYSPNSDAYGHGTLIAGVIGAVGNNGKGTAGINWNASILPAKADTGYGGMTSSNVAKAIIWSVDNGARIINLSMGIECESSVLKYAVNYAYDKGCAMFAATGNEASSSICYPAAYPNVMAVGATYDGVTRDAASNYGPGMGVLASSGYYATTAGGGYAGVGGTSISCAQVSGLASLIYAVKPEATPDEIYSLIQRGAGGRYNDQTGYGVINIARTLELAGAKTSVEPEKPKYFAPPTITLTGFIQMTLNAGDKYIETGYKAVDCLGANITASVVVTNNLKANSSGILDTAGVYTVTYTVTDAGGNKASATRTVVVNKAPEVSAAKPPTITPIGSNPIILNVSSATVYKEQGAKAYDSDGSDISSQVRVTGTVSRATVGDYTLKYEITGKDGQKATATRTVKIVGPKSQKIDRTPYSFSSQNKQGTVTTHTNIKPIASGYMDLKVSSIDKNMQITVQLIDTAANKAVLKDTFSAVGTKVYQIEGGKTYSLSVTIDKANGNSKYGIDLLMPENVTYVWDNEIPLGNWSPENIKDEDAPLGSLTGSGETMTYVVSNGDSLWRIAQKQYGNSSRWSEIYDMNKDVIGSDPGCLYTGQELTIPKD